MKTVRASARVTGLNFWSWGYGYLYDVYTVLKVDDREVDNVRTRTGFRKTEFAHGVLTLNDRVLQLKGYAQRTTNEWPAVGLSVQERVPGEEARARRGELDAAHEAAFGGSAERARLAPVHDLLALRGGRGRDVHGRRREAEHDERQDDQADCPHSWDT